MFVFCLFFWTSVINEYCALFSNEPLLAETWPIKTHPLAWILEARQIMILSMTSDLYPSTTNVILPLQTPFTNELRRAVNYTEVSQV